MPKRTNINAADFEQLIQIKGIGKAIAQKIIEARKKGIFLESMEDLNAIGKINAQFFKEIEASVSFEKVSVDDSEKEKPILQKTNLPPERPQKPKVATPKFDNEYEFKVNFSGLIAGDGQNPFSDYRLIVNYKIINHSNGNAISRSASFSIGNDASVNAIILRPIPSFGSLHDTFNLVVVSEKKGQVFNADFQIEEDGTAEVQVVEFNTDLDFNIQLITDSEANSNPYADHHLIVRYDLIDAQNQQTTSREEAVFPIEATGKSRIKLKDRDIVEKLNIQVKAPGGEVIGHKEISPSDIQDDGVIEISAPPRHQPNTDGLNTLPDRPKKTVGRVIDNSGKHKFEDAQVVLFVAHKTDPQDEDFYPLLVAKTETDGYFIIDTPQGYFTKAYGIVGAKDILSDPIDIRLESDTIVSMDDGEPVYEEKLFFPANIILMVNAESEENDDHDCGCNDCSDLDFHQPKKVLEEFSFYTVVRTTEPNIQSYTIEEEEEEMTVKDILEIVPIFDERGSGARAVIGNDILTKSIRKNVLRKFMNTKKGLTVTTLVKALNQSNAIKLRQVVQPVKEINKLGRHHLDLENPIDWDEEPTIYQATSLAHGHILHFKQEFINDGYSLGDLLYSLPLAPGQKKQIVVFDWERKESAARSESLDYQESLYNSLGRDRDINEIVSGALNEKMQGGSNANTSSASAGLGAGIIAGPVGALIGVSGGTSNANSTAWQNSSRNTTLKDIQKIRDKTVQSANAVRSQRATVIQTATQGERFSVETEVIANYNHCHSMVTMEYFEVLRHLKVQQHLADVRECLFVPLMMSKFDHQKILRWRGFLSDYVIERKLRKGFEAIERIENDYEGSDLPNGIYADDNVEYLEGYLNLKFQLTRPSDGEEDEFQEPAWSWALNLIPFISPVDFHKKHLKEQAEKDAVFQKELAPKIAEAFVQHLKFTAVTDEGAGSNEQLTEIPIDATLVSTYANNRSLHISLRVESELPTLKRSAIKYLEISGDIHGEDGDYIPLSELLPANSKVIVRSGSMNYRTKHISSYLFRNSRIQNDLTGIDKVRIFTPLNRLELRNPKNEDLELANALQDHLNDNLEFFHKVIWMNMSDERRFMFLDGIQVKDYSETEIYPDGVLRSVASVVENRVIGVAGNSLIMPVAPGFRLDPTIRGKEVDLVSLYRPLTPIEPMNLSIPTKGVFAEAVMGKCNSCEKKEEDRFWRWSEEPIPDNPTAIQPVSTDSRGTTPPDLTPTPLQSPVVNIQNAPNAPNPFGLDVAGQLLNSPAFDNITGLAGNQANAIEALKASFATTQAFGQEAAKLAALGAQLKAVKEAKENNQLSNEKASSLTEKAIDKSINTTGSSDNLEGRLSQLQKVKDMVSQNQLSAEDGDIISRSIIDKIKKNDLASVLENPAIQERISRGDGVDYKGKDESISLDKPDNTFGFPVIPMNKFHVHFRRSKTFKYKNGNFITYKGHYGFDWIRDEYVNPMTNISNDNNGAGINANRPLCKNIATMRQTYLNGVTNQITPYGMAYYPAWLSLFPYASTQKALEEIPHASVMHKYGAQLNLEIEEIDTLMQEGIELEFKIEGAAADALIVSPATLTAKDFLKKGTKVRRTLDAANNVQKNYWVLKNAVNVKCKNGVLTSHAEIKVMAKFGEQEQQVGQLMVYANDNIPHANIVLIELIMDNEDIALPKDIDWVMKNRSFNQALVRAEIDIENKFRLKNFDHNADVQAFITNYKGQTITNDTQFKNDLFALYEKYGKFKPDGGTIEGAQNRKTYMFITNLTAGTTLGSASLVVTQNAAGITTGWNWGNGVAIFKDGLDDEHTIIHELGHSLGLTHTQEPSNISNTSEFYQGTTDNVMDYDWKITGLVNPGNPAQGKTGVDSQFKGKQFYFFKDQWDKIRGDGSLEA